GGNAATGGSAGKGGTSTGGSSGAGNAAIGGSSARAGDGADGGAAGDGGISGAAGSAADGGTSPGGGGSDGGGTAGAAGAPSGARSCEKDCTDLANTECAGPDFDVAACIPDCEQAAQDAIDAASQIGCLDQFLALDACRADDPVCTHPNPNECVAENAAYIQCLEDAT
ncbi:MAG TPA: hypothetical protein VLJ38_11145, partial [Polyangiaceae bacterium]|nr:hypothetical protein [Polyangiaceae bacterium]